MFSVAMERLLVRLVQKEAVLSYVARCLAAQAVKLYLASLSRWAVRG